MRGGWSVVSGHSVHIVCRTRAVRVESDTRAAIVQEDSSGLCGGISNLYLCKGEPGKVLKIEVQCNIIHVEQPVMIITMARCQGGRGSRPASPRP